MGVVGHDNDLPDAGLGASSRFVRTPRRGPRMTHARRVLVSAVQINYHQAMNRFALMMVALTGCASTFIATGRSYAPRPRGCDLVVLTMPPSGGYVEIGSIESWSVRRGVDELKLDFGDMACGAGGDALYASSTTLHDGLSTVTVLKKTGALAGESGCQFDTQCKGDRVCVNHDCVDPRK